MFVQCEETFPSTSMIGGSVLDVMPAQYLDGAHRGRVCVRAFVGVSSCACMWASAIVVCSKKILFELPYNI
jgi:hypothetical protein